MSAEDWWNLVFQELDRGIIAEPYRLLLKAALARYGANPTFVELHDRYLTPSRQPASAQATCHVIVRADDEEQRLRAAHTLVSLRLNPTEVWSTANAVSYAVDSSDIESLRQALDATDLGWTLVPAGQPDYLLRELFVQGPDGSRFRVTDVPAGQTIRTVFGNVVEQYDPAHPTPAAAPVVADHIVADGERHRLRVDDTLHEAGIRDGDSVSVGFESRAGAPHPAMHVDALRAAGAQIREFAAAQPGMVARSDRPIEWDLEFEHPSFGPPGVDTGEPVPITRHVVRIQLGVDYPLLPPTVFWLTAIFHPNVFPTYPCEKADQQPEARGLVCLGEVVDRWTPAAGLASICQTIVDIAAYRNVNVGEVGGGRGNFYDEDAAAWWVHHMRQTRSRGVSLVVERVDP